MRRETEGADGEVTCVRSGEFLLNKIFTDSVKN